MQVNWNSALQGLSSGLAAAAAIAVTTYLFRTVRLVGRQEGNMTVLEYGRAIKVLVVIFWIFDVGVFVAAAFARGDEGVLAYSAAGGFFLLVMCLHLEFFGVTIRFDDAGLRTTSPWRRSRFIPWSAVTGIRFSTLAQWYLISTTEMGGVRLHLYLSGLPSLLDELARRGYPSPHWAQRPG
jgi:hypothetical protein